MTTITISVPHIGQDYGKVQVKYVYDDGETRVDEYEVAKDLAIALRGSHGDQDLEEEV